MDTLNMKKTFVISALVTMFFGMAFAPYVSGQAKGTINGHSYVDLGLSVKWATCNVGASTSEQYGNRYAWGETKTKSSYTEDNSVTYGRTMSSISGNAQYDAARANWGGTWRMPTDAEIEELLNKCRWQWATEGEREGYRVTGPNGMSIFLPAARLQIGLKQEGEKDGYYWSATSTDGNVGEACRLELYYSYANNGFAVRLRYRYLEGFIRPVSN